MNKNFDVLKSLSEDVDAEFDYSEITERMMRIGIESRACGAESDWDHRRIAICTLKLDRK